MTVIDLNKHKQTYSRLPCRGCTTQCKTYTTCNGTPWRINNNLADTNNKTK
ncbi:hypothetical protein LCGC14_0717220 [marine sediment metagenome]|uniref:Uncharacterized protein n=1 Tax=marine sediment metagenome TaxID=412755 RepID=A0A0F9QDD9_9ZZZZ